MSSSQSISLICLLHVKVESGLNMNTLCLALLDQMERLHSALNLKHGYWHGIVDALNLVKIVYIFNTNRSYDAFIVCSLFENDM